MYRNFTLTESEREQILNQHKEHGYKKPLSEQSQLQSMKDPDFMNRLKKDSEDKDLKKSGGRYYFNNGSSISIQGSSTHYCNPREDGAVYTELELGFPTQDVKLPKSFLKYQEAPGEDPTKSVFAYVPVEAIFRLEKMNGGFRSGQKLPSMMVNIGMSDENGKPKKDIWSGYVDESFDSMASNIEPYSKFESTERLMKSITDRLITAVQLQEWSLVEEVVSDLISFKKKEQSNEPSSVESDDYDERQERNYGVED